MNANLKTVAIAGLTALTLGAGTIAATSPVEAFGYHGGYHGHRGWGGPGVGAAALGLGLAGAAVASGAAYDYYHRPYNYNGYYGQPYNYGPYGY